MTNTDLFKAWNEALCSYFFSTDLEEDAEVSLYIDRATINELGEKNEIGGYDDFMRIIMLSEDDRKDVYRELRKHYIGTQMTLEQRTKLRSRNLFEFATIYIDTDFYSKLDCPFLIYIVFVIVMASECSRENRRGLGNYITEQLRAHFPGHTDRREALEDLFNELAKQHPRFCARKLTNHPYVGLIYYQLGLTKSQVNTLEKAMYNADLSEEIPYNQWIDKIVDYVDQATKNFLRDSKRKEIIRKRISDLREKFDPTMYEQKHQNEEIQSKGHFVLAVYEDDYSEVEDRLVLLTDINNKTISHDNLKITKGSLDRLGDYAEYNVNHVLIGDCDKAQMKAYSLNNGESRVTSLALGNIVTFTRCNNNYLIQTDYPQKGKETYILVRNGHDDEWKQWLVKQGSPEVKAERSTERVLQIFGKGWDMYISNEIKYVGRQTSCHVSTITMGGGINCPGRTNVYLITALPYIEFPEPIDCNELKINIKVNQTPVNLKKDQFSYKVLDSNKLVIDLIGIKPCDRSFNVKVSIIYKGQLHTEEFDVTGLKIKYKNSDLFNMNMWGEVTQQTGNLYMQGLKVFNNTCPKYLSEQTVLYQPQCSTNDGLRLIDPQDRRFYLVNLFAATSGMMKGFSVTEKIFKKCIRYAATRFEINVASIPSFYRDIRYLFINSGYMNVDYEKGKYQPIPPTFVKTPASLFGNDHLYLLMGSYTYNFLSDLVDYCRENKVNMFLHKSNVNISPAESFMPPVILLQYNFDPEKFMDQTRNHCEFYCNADVAVNILKSLPSYQQYETTLREIRPEVFNRRNLKEPPEDNDFPRVRDSKVTGYGAQKWIERRENCFSDITVPDIAWAKLYCLYKKNVAMCTQDKRDLLFPTNLHLPSMIQRALYITNFGIPLREKVFICNKADSNNNYFNIVKQYSTRNDQQQQSVFKALTGQNNDQNNTFVRSVVNCPHYRLKMWTNKNKSSSNPRSLMVIYNDLDIQGFAIKIKKGDYKIYFLDAGNNKFEQINSNDINTVFSQFMTTRKTWYQMGYTRNTEQHMELPSSDEYDKEEIKII